MSQDYLVKNWLSQALHVTLYFALWSTIQSVAGDIEGILLIATSRIYDLIPPNYQCLSQELIVTWLGVWRLAKDPNYMPKTLSDGIFIQLMLVKVSDY